MARIGLVLGAGGIAGHAFHAGVLRALEAVTGWDPRSAEIIIGTSAGSHVGALLRAELSAADAAARYSDQPLSSDGQRLFSRVGPPEPIPAPRLRAGAAASPRLLLRAALQPWNTRAGVIASALIPPGRVSLRHFAARVSWLFGEDWPAAPLWLPAVSLRDGQRVVFGRAGAPVTDVGTAVAASCAVPGWFAPVEVDGVRYVDGGAHSPTNLDLLAGAGLDVAVVVSPMSVARGTRHASLDLPVRTSWRLRLAEEARRVRRTGTRVVAFQPTAADLAVMGLNAMNPARRHRIVQQAHDSTLARLERASTRERLAELFPPGERMRPPA